MNDQYKEKAAQAEFKMREAYLHLAVAHSYLAASYTPASKTRPTNEECHKLFNQECDEAEKLMQEALGITNVGIARYIENPEPYKLTIGAILDSVKNTWLEVCFNALCEVQEIDPEAVHALYHRWLNGAE